MTTNPIYDFHPLLPDLINIMADVAETIPMRVFHGETSIAVVDKDDGTPVTEYDRHTEYALIKSLVELLPGSEVLGEETVGKGDAWRHSPLLQAMGNVWIVDPIDGTYRFIHHEPFGMLIGLRESGIMTLAVAYYPVSREFLCAARDKTGCLHVTERLHVGVEGDDDNRDLRWAVMPKKEMSQIALDYYINAAGKGHPRDIIGDNALTQFGGGSQVSWCIATSLYRLVMQGDLAIFACAYSPWDFETTALIARKAGAIVTHLNGSEAATTEDARDVVFSPTKEIAKLIASGHKRVLAAERT